MIFSYNWLKEWVDPDMDTPELCAALTMAGLEVDGHSAVARRFSGIVVAEVVSVEPHPDADKLRLCQVSDGQESFQVVCGAPNVKAGMKAPFARLGAEIDDGESDKPFKIKKAKLRGVESNGMLCSAEELGLEESSAGLLELPEEAPVGTDIRDYLGLDDVSIELDLTPNRGDCLGMRGVAREVGLLARKEVCNPEIRAVAASHGDEFPISISAPEACPRYLGRIIRNINLDAESPLWMQEKLRRSGLRSIDPVVDVTNYVLMELGQPMHAFDFAKLDGGIDVRMAKPAEKLTLLDGKEVELNEDILVIADASKAVAMAGIMGGEGTAVSDSSKDIFLECAFFAPLAISGKARQYGMHTDASHRYERGVDFELQSQAMERATQLLLDIVGGEAGPVTEALGQTPEAAQVSLRFANVERLLGISMPAAEIRDILTRLGLEIVSENTEGLEVKAPSFRFDIAIEADLIEELARVYGYNNIPRRAGLAASPLKADTEHKLPLRRLKQILVSLGYQETINYSFIEPGLAELVCGSQQFVRLQNPISEDMSVMRPSVLPGLLSTARYNQNRQQLRLRLFESGMVFTIDESGEISQEVMLAGLIVGRKMPENWSNNKEIYDFYDVKGDVETLLGQAGKLAEFTFLPEQASGFHPGRCARIEDSSGNFVGRIGGLHPQVQRQLDLQGEVFLFELRLAAVQAAKLPRYRNLSRYPEVSRDLAIVVDEAVPAGDLLALMRENAGEYLTDLRIFDVYQGDAITKNKKSLALGLTWQHPSRTLSDQEINAIISSCVNALQQQFNANLRD
jgi:phenylalanyl-tRNA synthetase beta chain